MVKIFCKLSNDANLTGFPVDFDLSLTVGDLKKTTRAEMSPEPESLKAKDLTLVRIRKADVGGLTNKELKQYKELLNLQLHGEDREDGDDIISDLSAVPGSCLERSGLLFKVCQFA
jgi:hypothetical protein